MGATVKAQVVVGHEVHYIDRNSQDTVATSESGVIELTAEQFEELKGFGAVVAAPATAEVAKVEPIADTTVAGQTEKVAVKK